MEINDNSPSEREWSIAEREEFFASQDARTGITPGLSGNPISTFNFRPSPSTHRCGDSLAASWHNGPPLTPTPSDDFEKLFNPGIHVTSIVPPAQGWPIAMHCPICKETTFLLSPWAAKPVRCDYFKMNDVCGSIEHGGQHNLRMSMKIDDHPIYKRLLDGPYDAVIEQEMSIEEAKRRFPDAPIRGQENI